MPSTNSLSPARSLPARDFSTGACVLRLPANAPGACLSAPSRGLRSPSACKCPGALLARDLSAGACVVVMGALLLLLVYFRHRKLLALWGGIVIVSGILLFLGGRVTSALEVFFCLSAGRLLRSLWARVV